MPPCCAVFLLAHEAFSLFAIRAASSAAGDDARGLKDSVDNDAHTYDQGIVVQVCANGKLLAPQNPGSEVAGVCNRSQPDSLQPTTDAASRPPHAPMPLQHRKSDFYLSLAMYGDRNTFNVEFVSACHVNG